jgi:TonB family protein
MAAPHQNIADLVVLKASAEDPQTDDLNLDGGAPVGASLAALRKAKGLTHDDVFAGTKIKPVHIAAIEAGDMGALPATPFTAGFVKAYAQFLGLDADRFARAYKEETGFVPLAAPALTAIMREAAKTRAAESRADGPAPPAAVSPPAAAAPAPISAAAALKPLAPAARQPAPPARGIEADKLVTWLGAGLAVAIAAFLAGRAVQPQQTNSDVAAPPPTIIAEAPPAAPAAEPVVPAPAEAVIEAPPAIEPVAPAPAAPVAPVVAAKAPTIKPQPKSRSAEETPPPVESTPVPVLYTTPVVEAAPPAAAAEAPSAAAAEAQPSETLPAEPPAAVAEEPAAPPAPVIVPARMIRGATPEYPERCAGRAGETVAVNVIFSITTDGRPVSASVVSSSDRCFNPAAQRAVYDMRFSPRTVDGAPAVETGKTVTVQFVR